MRLERPTLPRSWYSCDRPKRSASMMIMVLTLGISSPDSMMVVATSTLYSPSRNFIITSSSSRSPIWPWPTTTFASGTSSRIFRATVWMLLTRLYTT